ncbi:hypothetical protein MIR68_001871 [Amoeboaphelidium protococcarum]|nr:hypothetical protein MIR68_001871 [Amoeboaphelidium protococcarum]
MNPQFPQAVQNTGNNNQDICNQVRHSAKVYNQALVMNYDVVLPPADVDAISESQLLKHRAEHRALAGNVNNADILALLHEMNQTLVRIENEQLAQRQDIDQILNGLTNIRPIRNAARGRANARRAR